MNSVSYIVLAVVCDRVFCKLDSIEVYIYIIFICICVFYVA